MLVAQFKGLVLWKITIVGQSLPAIVIFLCLFFCDLILGKEFLLVITRILHYNDTVAWLYDMWFFCYRVVGEVRHSSNAIIPFGKISSSVFLERKLDTWVNGMICECHVGKRYRLIGRIVYHQIVGILVSAILAFEAHGRQIPISAVTNVKNFFENEVIHC